MWHDGELERVRNATAAHPGFSDVFDCMDDMGQFSVQVQKYLRTLGWEIGGTINEYFVKMVGFREPTRGDAWLGILPSFRISISLRSGETPGETGIYLRSNYSDEALSLNLEPPMVEIGPFDFRTRTDMLEVALQHKLLPKRRARFFPYRLDAHQRFAVVATLCGYDLFQRAKDTIAEAL